jgi:hypothetical protein
MGDAGRKPGPTVAIRRRDTGSEESASWSQARVEFLSAAAPWRSFRWRHGQRHFSGTYWSSTEHDHVVYESRLELSRLLFADFDVSVHRIVAQPFLLRARVTRQVRKNVPDFLLLTVGEPVVVDVKPHARLSRPEVDFTLSWTRELVEERGWRYEVWSEPPAVELENVRFLAGFRHERRFDRALLDELRAEIRFGQSLGEASRCRSRWPEPLVRSALLHLVWTHHFTVDLTRPLTTGVTLEEGARA